MAQKVHRRAELMQVRHCLSLAFPLPVFSQAVPFLAVLQPPPASKPKHRAGRRADGGGAVYRLLVRPALPPP